jgi:hypothetical protein
MRTGLAGNKKSPDSGPLRTRTREIAIRDCALIAIATGVQAGSLVELRDRFHTIDSASIHYHFWGGLLRPKFDDPEYRNDFAIWSRNDLHDEKLGERLGILDPTSFDSIEALRRVILEVLNTRVEETGDAAATAPFHFVRSQIVVFDTGVRLRRPERLARLLPRLSLGSIYFHFIDARRRSPEGLDDFAGWFRQCGDRYAELAEHFSNLDYYFISLARLRRELATHLREHFAGLRNRKGDS